MPSKMSEDELIANRTLGNNINRHRRAIGMSGHELAVRIGFKTEASLYPYEAGSRTFNTIRLLKVADVLGVGVDTLFEGTQIKGMSEAEYLKIKAKVGSYARKRPKSEPAWDERLSMKPGDGCAHPFIKGLKARMRLGGRLIYTLKYEEAGMNRERILCDHTEDSLSVEEQALRFLRDIEDSVPVIPLPKRR